MNIQLIIDMNTDRVSIDQLTAIWLMMRPCSPHQEDHNQTQDDNIKVYNIIRILVQQLSVHYK